MIEYERFEKNLNLLHLAYVSGNDEIVIRIMKGLLAVFPKGKDILEHFCIFTNFGLLEGHEKTPEELYNELIENEIV